MSPEKLARDFAVKKVGASVGQDYWRSQLEEAWMDGWLTHGVAKSRVFSDKNRELRDQVDPTTGERVELKTKKQIEKDFAFELEL